MPMGAKKAVMVRMISIMASTQYSRTVSTP
jgi:hypothetical protein